MKCKTIAILLFLAMHFVTEAKQLKNSEGIEVLSTHANIQNGYTDRSETISADITGSLLTITFNDNVGIAHIVIKDSNGVYIDRDNVFSTPDYATFIIRELL